MKLIERSIIVLEYLLLNIADWIRDKIRYRMWAHASIVVYKHYSSSLKEADIYQRNGEAIARIVTCDNIHFLGPTDQAGSMCSKNKIRLLRRIFERNGHRHIDDACLALFHNVVMRYWNEFCAYPDNQIRTTNLRAGDYFIDIGAFRGYVSLKAAQKVGDAGRVISIEPMQQNCRYIEMHKELNRLSNWEILQGVASAQKSANANIYTTRNQVNSLSNKHISSGAVSLSVVNHNIVEVLEKCIRESKNRRIIISLTTNGDEMEMALACLLAPSIAGLDYLQLVIPIIYTRKDVAAFKSKASDIRRELVYMESYPWLSITWSSN